jgi:hypothetical protein
VLSVLNLHKELNPVRGTPLLVGLDQSTGQLFFCSARGSCLKRERAISESVQRQLYDAWPQLRPSA